jgi:linoleoyl-CoA desaturase
MSLRKTTYLTITTRGSRVGSGVCVRLNAALWRTMTDTVTATPADVGAVPEIPRVTFPGIGAESLAANLKERVSAHFCGRSDKANSLMVIRTVVMLTVTFGSYALILTKWFSPLAMLGLAIVAGIGMAGIGFGIAHDAAHGAYSSSPTLNRILAYAFDLCGASSYMWGLGHNIVHHTYTNIPGIDGDLISSGLLRQSPGRDARWYHRYQQLYAFPLYSLATLNWALLKDYQELSHHTFGPYRNHVHPKSAIVTMLGFKVLHYGWSFFIPFFVLAIPWWQVLIGYLAMHLTAGLILGTVFPLAHVVEGPTFPLPAADGTMNDAWIAHELSTTANFAHKNRLFTWYIGSLNYQIEHHLFTRVCSVHFPALSGIVRDVARSHGLPYHYNSTFFAAVRSHYRMLKKFGRSEAEGRAEPATGLSAATV